jgi:hypothetical protein
MNLYSAVTQILDSNAFLYSIYNPTLLAKKVRSAIPYQVDKIIAVGTVDSRILIVTSGAGRTLVVSLSRSSLRQHKLNRVYRNQVVIDNPQAPISYANFSEEVMHRLEFPHVKLVGLYHSENFPLPRFALGISDLARAIRENLVGSVSLVDMQLGAMIIVSAIEGLYRAMRMLLSRQKARLFVPMMP